MRLLVLLILLVQHARYFIGLSTAQVIETWICVRPKACCGLAMSDKIYHCHLYTALFLLLLYNAATQKDIRNLSD